jgi:hypothetical protein
MNATPINAAAELEPRTDTGNGPSSCLSTPSAASTMWGRFHDLLGKARRVVTYDRRGCNATSGRKVVLPQARPYLKALLFLADSG